MRTSVILIACASIAVGQQIDRTLPFRNLQSTPDFAEAATVIRSIGEIRDLQVNAAERSLSLHADPEQVAFADWLFTKLDRNDEPIPGPGPLDYRTTQGSSDLIRVVYFRYLKTPEDIRQLSTVVRSLTEIRRAFVSIAAGAFVARGTQDQMDAASWLIDSLDKPELGTGTKEYRMGGNGEDVIGLLHVPAASSEELQNFGSQVVLATQSRYVFTYYPLRVIAIRNTPAKLQEAAKVMGQSR
jgi:hypothetical protein